MAAPKPAHTQAQIIAALKQSKGRQFLAAHNLGCSQKTIERAMKRYPAAAELVKLYRGRDVDTVEQVLVDKAIAGEPWAVCFYLKTQAKHRGYTERHEFKHIKELSDDELIRAIKERTGGDPGDDTRGGTPGTPEAAATLH